MPKRPAKPLPEADRDSQELRQWLLAMIEAHGRGGKAWAARRLGITRSNLTKRLKSPSGMFDVVTFRAIILAMETKSHDPLHTGLKTMGYVIDGEPGRQAWSRE